MAPVRRAGICLLLSCLTFSHSVSSCDVGWFGDRCQYKCHCQKSSCDIQGGCTKGSKCERGWFGPACQYQDLAVNGSILTLPFQQRDKILDGDDDTCHDNLQQIILTWSSNQPLNWFRIKVLESDPDELLNLTFLLKPYKANDASALNNPYIKCNRKRTSFINNRTVDVYCDLREGVQEILVYGAGIKTLCAFYVNIGRNVALKQTAWQSSTVSTGDAVASRAVDGKWLGYYKDNSCTHTGETDRTPVWKLTLSQPANINRFEILNRNDCCQRRLMSFSIETLSAKNASVHAYTDYSNTPQNSFTILSPELKEPVTTLIVAAHNDWQGSIILTLCEVELYGDSVCPPGKYGFDCNENCNCAIQDDECFVSTGTCASGCAAGYYGDGCKQPCSPHFWGVNCLSRCIERCSGSSCDSVTGRCVSGCQIGYAAPDCMEACPPHFWGENCLSRCSERCSGSSCDSVTGRCVSGCQIGYTPPDCTEVCNPGYYGANCTQICPANCANSTCDHVNGSCACPPHFWGVNCLSRCSERCSGSSCDSVTGRCVNGCQLGYTPPDCTEVCNPGYYGANCTQTCPANCANGTCDHVDGLCVCKAGFHGATCSQACSERCCNGTCHHVTGQCPLWVKDNVESQNYTCKKREQTKPDTFVRDSLIALLIFSLAGNILAAAVMYGPRFKQKWDANQLKGEEQKAESEDVDLSQSVFLTKIISVGDVDNRREDVDVGREVADSGGRRCR